MGSINTTYVEQTNSGDPHPDTVDITQTDPEFIVGRVILDPTSVDPLDIQIMNAIGKFIKPMEERISFLERQVQLLLSLTHPLEVEIRKQNDINKNEIPSS